MKLATFLAGSAHASQAFREAQTIPNSHVCGSVNAVVGQNTTLNEQVELGYVEKRENCQKILAQKSAKFELVRNFNSKQKI